MLPRSESSVGARSWRLCYRLDVDVIMHTSGAAEMPRPCTWALPTPKFPPNPSSWHCDGVAQTPCDVFLLAFPSSGARSCVFPHHSRQSHTALHCTPSPRPLRQPFDDPIHPTAQSYTRPTPSRCKSWHAGVTIGKENTSGAPPPPPCCWCWCCG